MGGQTPTSDGASSVHVGRGRTSGQVCSASCRVYEGYPIG